MDLRSRRLCRPRCILAAWPFFYETDTSIQDISLKKVRKLADLFEGNFLMKRQLVMLFSCKKECYFNIK
jgi:hypothetical protein